MGAILYAWGDGVRVGAGLEEARAVDLFPSLCQLMGLPVPEGLDGAALGALLSQRGQEP